MDSSMRNDDLRDIYYLKLIQLTADSFNGVSIAGKCFRGKCGSLSRESDEYDVSIKFVYVKKKNK